MAAGNDDDDCLPLNLRRCYTEEEDGSTMSPHIIVGAGCYFGTEKFMSRNFTNRFPQSVDSYRVGYMMPPDGAKRKGAVKNSSISYAQISRGNSEYIEVCWLELSDPRSHFEAAVRFFFCFHDPTTRDRQGADRGNQYSSVLFVLDDEQFRIAELVRQELQQRINDGKVHCFLRRRVETKIVKVGGLDEARKLFVEAQQNHQDYLLKNPTGYCSHFLRSRNSKPRRTRWQWKLRDLAIGLVPSLPSSS